MAIVLVEYTGDVDKRLHIVEHEADRIEVDGKSLVVWRSGVRIAVYSPVERPRATLIP